MAVRMPHLSSVSSWMILAEPLSLAQLLCLWPVSCLVKAQFPFCPLDGCEEPSENLTGFLSVLCR